MFKALLHITGMPSSRQVVFAFKDKAVCTYDEEVGEQPKKGPLSPERSLGWTRDPLSGVTFAHNRHTVIDIYSIMRDPQLSRAK
jgi:hypothetical protein